eukprot:TRINITY_DN1882_c0_g1_i1.p1 TRINITY_DN1882_c0_g1~~TRINITY_DN1882_c0_g1_i1.p1  ORF type:complete len:549 (-),score=84.03 TRINITY_DN1882_c0_g1_i1:111-1757(-)
MSELCPKCSKRVYHAERVQAGGMVWHNTCFKCETCGKKLSLGQESLKDDKVYCKQDYLKLYSSVGSNVLEHTAEKVPVARSGPTIATGGVSCPKCGKSVYHNERVVAEGSEYHQGCFKCENCSKTLRSGEYDSHESHQYFCHACYKQLHSSQALSSRPDSVTKSANYVGGSSGMDTTSPKCPICGKSVYFNERIVALGKDYHKDCFKCSACSKVLRAGEYTERGEEAYCQACYGKNFSTTALKPTEPSVATTSDSASSGSPKCPVCGKAVYFNEKITAIGKDFHKTCFKCQECSKVLRGGEYTEREEDIFCKACYAKLFSTAGYGYGGTLSSADKPSEEKFKPTTNNSNLRQGPSVSTTSPKCPICNKSVFFNEKITALGKDYHKACFKCTECSKVLRGGEYSERDDNVYCKVCYGKLFSPAGYGFGGAISSADKAADAGAVNAKPAFKNVSSNVSVGSSGPKCPKCGKSVFFNEKLTAFGQDWHQDCFRCETCNKILRGGEWAGRDDKPYCKKDYEAQFSTAPKVYAKPDEKHINERSPEVEPESYP